MIDGIWVCFLFVLLLWVGGSRRAGVKKGGVLAYIGVHGGLLFFCLLFTPEVFLFISLHCYTDWCRRCLAFVFVLALLAMFIPRRQPRPLVYIYSVISIMCFSQAILGIVFVSKIDGRGY